MTDARDRGWGPGWPVNRSKDMRPLIVDGVSFAPGVHKDIHDLMELILLKFDGRERLKKGWCWGYANRAITGTTDIPSNHSWGLAIDINAPQNGYGASTHTISASEAHIFTQYGFRWGGQYDSTKDWMHFEFMGSPADAKRETERARRELGTGEDDEDMSYEKFKEGWKNFRAGKGEPDDKADNDLRFGWHAAALAAKGDIADPTPNQGPGKHTHDITAKSFVLEVGPSEPVEPDNDNDRRGLFGGKK